MLTLDDFGVGPEVKSIFLNQKIDEPSDILYNLEMYKFLSRTELIIKLNTLLLPSEFSEVLTEGDNIQGLFDISTIERDSALYALEEENDVLCNVISQYSVEVILPLFRTFDRTSLELNLHYDTIKYKVVTPFNFMQLKTNNATPVYEPMMVFKRLVLECCNKKATDLHLTVIHDGIEPSYIAQYRKEGLLCDLNLFPMNRDLNEQIIRKSIASKTNKDAIDLDTSSGVTTVIPDVFNDGTVSLRMSANKVVDGFELVCRLQRPSTVTLTIDKLGFPLYVQNALHKLTKRRSGITLITGPVRTGKNTTAFALANEMMQYPIKIKSFESPVEVLMPFPQVDYMDDPVGLANSVRLAKKQDINVAFLNEIPNKEVAFAVRDLVNSSVYVITTLHLDRIWHTPYKLYEYYGDSYKDVISQLNGLVNQKMFGVLCPHCKHEALTADLEDEDKRNLLQSQGVMQYAFSSGCDECTDFESGISGVIPGRNQPYVEYLIFTDEIKSKLLACNAPYEMEQIIKDEVRSKNQTLEYELCKAIKEQQLSIDALDYIL